MNKAYQLDHQLSVERIETLEQFKKIKNEWGNLYRKCSNRSLFLSWEWSLSWWEIYQPGKELWLIIVREDGDLVGIAPLMLVRQKKYAFQLRILQTLGTPQADVGGFLQEGNNPDIAMAVFEYLKEMKTRWDILELNELPKPYHDLIWSKAPFNPQKYLQINLIKEHYHVITQGKWEDYYHSLSKKFRKNIRRSIRNSDSLGKVEFRAYPGNKVTWPIFKIIIEINRHSHYPRLANSKREQAFHKELLRNMENTNSIVAFLLFIDGQPAAYEYGFLHEGHFENWRAGFDTRYDPTISIGKLLSLKITEYAFAQNYLEIDFLRGDEAYKKDWRPYSRQYVSTRVFQSRKIKSLLTFIWLRYLKPLIKE